MLRPPALDPQLDAAVAIYAGSGAVGNVRVEVSLHPTAEAASAQFGPIAEALKNPPPDLFGPGTVQTEGQPVYQAEGARSYVTARPDRDGNLVYTDAYRMGRAVIIVYTLGSDADAVRSVREGVARRLDGRAPR
ncbi:hypothetical protein [Tepidiforma sp.]|uniref:hypothetical protein n=1 Tax=Tepidiforma sp. TaxID=2682230 RepID=UPI002ADDF435|nr:hypothetical protein [Tepidiforma sp.]